MSDHFSYLISWLVTSLLLYLANVIFPDTVVLGNYKFSAGEGAAYAGFWITFLVWLIHDMVVVKGLNPESKLGSWVFAIIVGAAAIWMSARFAPFTGFGIANYRWALLLGVFIGLGTLRIRSFIIRKEKAFSRR